MDKTTKKECRQKSKIVLSERPAAARPALFLDRDGVVIIDKHYIDDPKDVEVNLEIVKTIQCAKSRGFGVVIVTNQSGISRGLFSWEEYYRVTVKMLELVGVSGRPDAIYANGYSNTLESDWRKPRCGMLTEACKDLNIVIEKSVMIGDRWSDMEAGARAGVRDTVMVGVTKNGASIPSSEHIMNAASLHQVRIEDVLKKFKGITSGYNEAENSYQGGDEGVLDIDDVKRLDMFLP